MSKEEDKFDFSGIDEIKAGDTPPSSEVENILTDTEISELNQEVELEREFGNAPVRTFAESALSSATFGISDKVAVEASRLLGGDDEADKTQQGLRERRQRNEISNITGEVTGVLGSALLSGGSSTVAKAASAGVKTAAKAGLATEKITAKALAKIISESGNKKIAKSIISKSIPKTAGSAVEGAFYGAGQLVSEEALGTAEFNAENLIASVGTGALFSGVAGGVFGAGQIVVPVIKNSKVVDVTTKKVKEFADPLQNASRLFGLTDKANKELRKTAWGQRIYENFTNFYENNIKASFITSKKSIKKKAVEEFDRLGDEIGSIVNDVNKLASKKGLYLTNSKVNSRVVKGLQELLDEYKGIPGTNTKKITNEIRKEINHFEQLLGDNTKLSAKRLKEVKTKLQSSAKNSKSITDMSIRERIDFTIGEKYREELSEFAFLVDNSLGEKLGKTNLDYATSIVVRDNIDKVINSGKSSIGDTARDILLAGSLATLSPTLTGTALIGKKIVESDLKRHLSIKIGLEKANNKVTKKISTGINSFFKSTKSASTPVSTTVLLNTSFSLPDEFGKKPKKPKTKKEAFKKVSEDIIELTSNPERLINHLSNNALSQTQSAPNTGASVNQTLSTALNFLSSKIPTDPSPNSGLFSRTYEPSSIEIAKFERYLQAVENPLSAIDDLESGTLTNEAVEVLQVVYPDIYSRIKEAAISEIANNPDTTYAKRLQLGMLLDIDADTSLISTNIVGLQQTFSDEEQAQNAARKDDSAVETTQGGLQGITESDDQKSQSERISTRE